MTSIYMDAEITGAVLQKVVCCHRGCLATGKVGPNRGIVRAPGFGSEFILAHDPCPVMRVCPLCIRYVPTATTPHFRHGAHIISLGA